MPSVVVFDVNETLLDLAALDSVFERIFGDASVRQDWFAQVLQSALTTTLLGTYVDFSTIGRGALDMVAQRRGVLLSDLDRSALAEAVRTCPPHDDVPESLSRLRDAGFRLAALSNGTPEVLNHQLDHAGLRDAFEAILSADAARRLKPAPEPYRMAAETLGVDLSDIRFVAAHTWDVAGAMQVGCAAAFVARPGKVPDPALPTPAITGTTLRDVTDQIINQDAHQ